MEEAGSESRGEKKGRGCYGWEEGKCEWCEERCDRESVCCWLEMIRRVFEEILAGLIVIE